MGKYFAVLDVGCEKIAAVAAGWCKNGDYRIEAFSYTPAAGFRKGTVTDISMATDSVAMALSRLRKKTHGRIHEVYTAISSSSVEIVPSSGVLLLSRYGREISERDIKKCVGIASTVKMPLDREALHRIIGGFSVDGERGIKDPLNLEAVKLGACVDLVTINSTTLRNISKCISQAGFIPAGFVFSGLAASYRVLGADDREEGAALLDICADAAELSIFHRGRLKSCRVFPKGARYLSARDGGIDRAALEKLAGEFAKTDGWEKARKTVVIGEGTLVDGLIESLETVLPVPVTAGMCASRPLEELLPERAAYVRSLGVLDHLQQERRRGKDHRNILKRAANRAINFIDKYF